MADGHVTNTKLYRVEEIPQDELNLQVYIWEQHISNKLIE